MRARSLLGKYSWDAMLANNISQTGCDTIWSDPNATATQLLDAVCPTERERVTHFVLRQWQKVGRTIKPVVVREVFIPDDDPLWQEKAFLKCHYRSYYHHGGTLDAPHYAKPLVNCHDPVDDEFCDSEKLPRGTIYADLAFTLYPTTKKFIELIESDLRRSARKGGAQ